MCVISLSLFSPIGASLHGLIKDINSEALGQTLSCADAALFGRGLWQSYLEDGSWNIDSDITVACTTDPEEKDVPNLNAKGVHHTGTPPTFIILSLLIIVF